MSDKKKVCFIKEYAAAINRGDAAAFIGAGMSVPSGFVDWKGLLSDLAEEIGLSVEKEKDLLAVAQYYVNEKNNRLKISQRIKDEFSYAKESNKSVEEFVKLNIKTVWTTNYDHVLEEAYEAFGKKVDVKKCESDLLLYDEDASVCMYKMHGDVSVPNETVLIKDEYENYFNLRKGFVTSLKAHLMSKTFLFLGYSFSDPNINNILGWIRQLADGSKRSHYWITKRVNAGDNDYQYLLGKQELIVNDMKRYGIETVLVDDYKEIPKIFEQILLECNRNMIFISGSCGYIPEGWTAQEVDMYVSSLSESLVNRKYSITSGYGLGIGNSVITGVLRSVNQNKYAHFDKYIKLYPFPQNVNNPQKERNDYRSNMIEKCGVSLFLFGNKINDDGVVMIAKGVINEYEIAREKKLILIPLAFTGYAAEEIYEMMKKEKDRYPYLAEYWDDLQNKQSVTDTMKLIIKIIQKAEELIYE